MYWKAFKLCWFGAGFLTLDVLAIMEQQQANRPHRKTKEKKHASGGGSSVLVRICGESNVVRRAQPEGVRVLEPGEAAQAGGAVA